MTTDNKTLADVQPGGRVRLGDQAERARFEEWYVQNAFDYVANPIGSRDCAFMRKAWNAALSAQPSPGGQDALELLEAYDQAVEELSAELSEGWNEDNRRPQLESDVAELRAELIAALAARQPVTMDDALAAGDGTLHGAIDHWQERALRAEAELAARQPVGEPVALGETDPIPCAWSDDDASSLVTLRDALRRIIAGTTTKDAAHFLKQPGQRRMTIKDAQEVAAAHLPYVESLVHRSQGYAAPPAQAVDLEQFRPAVCAMGLHAEEPEDVDEAKRLLALIDSQAVGK